MNRVLLVLLLLLPLTPACVHVPSLVQTEMSEATTHHGFVWWAERRAYTDSEYDRVRIVMCNPEGVPPCVVHTVPDVNARQLRQWIDRGRVGGDD